MLPRPPARLALSVSVPGAIVVVGTPCYAGAEDPGACDGLYIASITPTPARHVEVAPRDTSGPPPTIFYTVPRPGVAPAVPVTFL